MKLMYKPLSYFLIILVLLAACQAKAVTENAAGSTAKKYSELTDKKPITLAAPKRIKPLDVPLINQMDPPRLYNGCEVSSLAMVLNYHGIKVSKNELAEKIDRVPLAYGNGLKGNPNDGFVGNMEDGPGLAVYHGPVKKLAEQYAGGKTADITGEPIDVLYKYLTEGMPVWVITTVNSVPVNDWEAWETPSGIVEVTYSVHSVVMTGFDEDYVYINNPYGQKNQKVDKQGFEKAWKQMGSQAIVIER
ncbi:C39 family peptidase [Virgibacillus dakarensis]|uniref:C39 family peptidase n=1 Tax=Virgibacillus dakarensis TaxID=1917889 RepID=UPI001F2835D5|nr:C39 family peptidase [Virgibacillus dakarensis]